MGYLPDPEGWNLKDDFLTSLLQEYAEVCGDVPVDEDLLEYPLDIQLQEMIRRAREARLER